MNKDRIIEFVNNDFDKLVIPSLTEYIKIPNLSPAFDKKWKENGYLKDAAQHLRDFAKEYGISGMNVVKVFDDYAPLIFITIQASSQDIHESILMYGHYDKQPWGEGWDSDKGPTKPVVIGDRLYGRGAADDGYSIYAALLSIKGIQDQQLPHPRIVILIEGDEESGSTDMPGYLSELEVYRLCNNRI